MRYLYFLLVLLVPTTSTAEVCSFKWSHDNLREDETPILDADMFFQVRVQGKILPVIQGANRAYGWFTFGKCPLCNEVEVRTVDANNTKLKSAWAQKTCPPNQPVLCK